MAFTVVIALLVAGAGFVLLSGGGGDSVESTAGGTDDGSGEQPVDGEANGSVVPSTGPEPEQTTAVSTVPAQVTPITIASPTTTEAPPAPTVTAAPPPATPARVPGDLGLAQPMTRPPCDGTYITLVASSLNTATNAQAVSEALARYPGSAYLKTAETCPSLTPSRDGAEIYVVYFGPFLTSNEACVARSSGPSDAYVRILSLSVPNTHTVSC